MCRKSVYQNLRQQMRLKLYLAFCVRESQESTFPTIILYELTYVHIIEIEID